VSPQAKTTADAAAGTAASAPSEREVAEAVTRLIQFMETGSAPDGLFAPHMFTDLSLPHWRLQAGTAQGLVDIRTADHPFPGQVRVERVERTTRGFTLEFEERWQDGGEQWYCREMIRADLAGGRIVEMSIYCTGDWDEAKQRAHAEAVRLIRP